MYVSTYFGVVSCVVCRVLWMKRNVVTGEVTSVDGARGSFQEG